VKDAFLLPSNAAPSLIGRDVAFEVVPSTKAGPTKTEVRRLRLCSPSEATGTIKSYNPVLGFGFVTGKDGMESILHHSQVTDFGPFPAKLNVGDPVEFDVQPGVKGPVASNVRRAA